MSAPVTPGQGQGLGCHIVLAALVVLFGGSLYLAVHLIVAVIR